MFQISVTCEDRKVADVLWALDGLIVGEPTIRPIRAAKVERGQIKATAPGGTLVEKMAIYLNHHVRNGQTLNGTQLRAALHAVGGKDGSYGGVIKNLAQAGVLSGKGGRGNPWVFQAAAMKEATHGQG